MKCAEALDWLCRCAAKHTHPDAGGRHEEFLRTREAYETLRGALSAGDAEQGGRSDADAPDLDALLVRHGLKVVDKRPAGGRLWVVAGEEVRALMDELARQGYGFTYAPPGGRATSRLPGWYL